MKYLTESRMKCINAHTYEKLGFDVILAYIQQKAMSREAKEACMHIAPSSDTALLLPELKKVREYKQLLEYDDAFPEAVFMGMSQVVEKLQIAGNWLSAEELFRLLNWLRHLQNARAYFQARKEAYPLLYEMLHAGSLENRLADRISNILDERGNIRDNASPELARIRKEMVVKSAEIRKLMSRVLRHAQQNNWSVEKEVAIRNGRMVIPVRAEAKGRIPGFVQDVSQSGGTVYIEPSESLAINNRLRELEIREHNEVIRILTAITAEIRPHLPQIAAFSELITQLDLIRAKALLAVELQAELPLIEAEGEVLDLRDAYYPLLQLKARQTKAEVVPLHLKLDKKSRIVLISGPNAGGKSVSMKTVGLLQLMLQAGMLVPVNEGSVFRIFDGLFLDIGDEQSIDNDLSTYTSRLYQMRLMGDQMNQRSLFLIDEFGSGTDPKLGGAIAEAFLERFLRQGAYGVITTHYGNLKDFAEVTPGIMNAAMQFDTQELKPTYFLMPGIPGRSYAFEMARRVGVHPSILRRARKKAGSGEMEVEQLLRKLEQKTTELNHLLKENQQKSRQLKELVGQNEALKQELEQNKKQIMREAKAEARALIQQSNKLIEQTIREIKEKQAEKKATQKLRQKLKAAMPLPEPVEESVRPEAQQASVKVLPGEVKPGDWVKWKNSDNYGRLVEIQGKKRGLVEMGEVRLTARLDQLQKIEPPASSSRKQIPATHLPFVQAQFELDVMGKRVEEALPEVDKLLDQAMLGGLKWVKILHGKGSGVLRDAIRKHLKDFPFVAGVEDAPIEQGGAGWTIVELKA